MSLLHYIAFMHNVLCLNIFNHFTSFNTGRIMKDDRCLIKSLQTEQESLANANVKRATAVHV